MLQCNVTRAACSHISLPLMQLPHPQPPPPSQTPCPPPPASPPRSHTPGNPSLPPGPLLHAHTCCKHPLEIGLHLFEGIGKVGARCERVIRNALEGLIHTNHLNLQHKLADARHTTGLEQSRVSLLLG